MLRLAVNGMNQPGQESGAITMTQLMWGMAQDLATVTVIVHLAHHSAIIMDIVRTMKIQEEEGS